MVVFVIVLILNIMNEIILCAIIQGCSHDSKIGGSFFLPVPTNVQLQRSKASTGEESWGGGRGDPSPAVWESGGVSS